MTRWLFLLRELVRRDFQARYAGSLLGFVWSLVQPLWQLLLFTFVFSTVLRISLLGERTGSFAVFLFCGLLPWMAIHEALVRSTTAVTDNAELVKKVRFPAEMLVLTVVLAALLHEAIAAAVFIVLLVWIGELSLPSLPLLALAVPIQVALTLGLGLILAPLHALFRDTAQVVGLVLAAWFYLTPIVYPLSLVPERYRAWILYNPLTTLVELYRGALLGAADGWGIEVGVVALAAGALLLAGWAFFRRLRGQMVDAV